MTLLDSIRDAAQRLIAQRELDGLMKTCRHLLSARGEANSADLATQAIEHYRRLPDAAHLIFFQQLATGFNPDPTAVLAAAERYAETPTADHLVQLFFVTEPPRQELLRRLNRAPGGTVAIVQMRRALLRALAHHPELAAVEADMLHLLSSWFNPGFLEMQQVDWASPARLLEKIIHHEAVHAIDGWDDLRRRLQPDRRCFAFFHPQLPEEPLIFVEVALLEEVPPAIGPLIEKKSDTASSKRFKVAAFYSISNCQPGLRGVSLGNFLIKRVAERLKSEFPSIKTFCTLSPIPGFVRWLDSDLEATAARLKAPVRARWEAGRKELKAGARQDARAARAAVASVALVRGRAEGAARTGLDLPARVLAVRRGRRGRQVPPEQRRPVAAHQLGCRPLAQRVAAVVRADGQLPLRPRPGRGVPPALPGRRGRALTSGRTAGMITAGRPQSGRVFRGRQESTHQETAR